MTTFTVDHATTMHHFDISLKYLSPQIAEAILTTLFANDPRALDGHQAGTINTLISVSRKNAEVASIARGGIDSMLKTAANADDERGRALRTLDTQLTTARIVNEVKRGEPVKMSGAPITGPDLAAREASDAAYRERFPSTAELQRKPTEYAIDHVIDDASADLRWFPHATTQGVIIANHRGLSFELRDDLHSGTILRVVEDTAPPVPLIWQNNYNCNTAGSAWFANDKEAKLAAMAVARARNEQLREDLNVS